MSSIPVARAGAGLRLLRASVFTAVCVVLSATGHALAACAAVPWWTLAIGFLGVFALVAPFAGRARSLPSIAVALTAGQLALHALFGAGQSHLRLAPTADDALIRMAAKLVCGAGSSSLSPADAHRIVTNAGIDPTAHGVHTHMAGTSAASPGLLPSLPMLLAHLLAAVATGWLLRRGDLALLRLIRLSADSAHEVAEAAWLRSLRAALVLVRALRAGLTGTPAVDPRTPRPSSAPPVPPAGEALQHTVIRRGPPAVRLALAA
ncbi:hypothetical protein HRW23_21840 [Streptomyces lunaelactis]|uniref:hypothetical protein n=1 Tax=Streptomyces lunaelactis TaxID=1535768 RepID=UPI001584831A|nr:hypothetical protein [Streptomyces lunaelactis]NUK03650.1 hypothetical protein [Streptomyces lunaelactis]NUK14887.1 hypothetical protein [Streptomyces lunaelactis]NUK25621.1 hypothetical protein [Streptomyces lunaelactis]NUK36918.1 hypothetical protein [Streptomyces lunaelactis]NUK43551.1 hypothetical protein [Streptomyces lunaelactis]